MTLPRLRSLLTVTVFAGLSLGLVSTSVAAPLQPIKPVKPVSPIGEVNKKIDLPTKPTLRFKKEAKMAIRAPTLDNREQRALAKTRFLDAAGVRDAISNAGLAQLGEVGGRVEITPRRPYAGSQAFFSYIGAATANPADGPKGVAAIMGDPRDTIDVSIPNPFGGMYSGTPINDNSLVVDFRAAKNKHYLVECTWRSKNRPSGVAPGLYEPVRADDFYTRVRDGAEELTGGAAVRDNLVVQVVPARTQSRRVVVKVKADQSFLTTGCAVTPVSG